MMIMEIAAVYSGNHTEHINVVTVWVKCSLNVTVVGVHSNRRD